MRRVWEQRGKHFEERKADDINQKKILSSRCRCSVYGIAGLDTVVPLGQVVAYKYYIHPELRI